VLITGCPVYHAEVTAIIDASAKLNPKGLLGSEDGAGTILEMIPREPGSTEPVPERARMLKQRDLHQCGSMSDVHERHLLGPHRPCVFRL
jgi:guanine deaminase